MKLTPRSKTVLVLALRKAQELGQDFLATDHLLAGLILERSGRVSQLLERHGVTIEHLAREAGWVDPAQKEVVAFQDLSPEAQDLVVRAALGEFDETGPPEIPEAMREQITQWACFGADPVAVKPKA
jgi:ATP-dependent Clp protease ATP-binding subunit ClpA